QLVACVLLAIEGPGGLASAAVWVRAHVHHEAVGSAPVPAGDVADWLAAHESAWSSSSRALSVRLPPALPDSPVSMPRSRASRMRARMVSTFAAVTRARVTPGRLSPRLTVDTYASATSA